jgi:hypothetical protein
MKTMLTIAIALAACGGHKQQPTTPPPDPGNGTATPPPETSGDNMVSPEQIDEIQHDFGRKQQVISRCLAMAMDNKDVKRGTHGKIALEVVIEPSGSASSIKVIKTDIDVKSVVDCTIKHVQEIEFPHLPQRYETSFTYAMEAN